MSPRPRALSALGVIVTIVGVTLVLLVMNAGSAPVANVAATPTSSAATSSLPTPGPSPVSTPGATSPTSSRHAERAAEVAARPETKIATGPSLRIPGIDLSARLHAEGLRDGRINPPAGTVMWFTGYGRVPPGEIGTSVIAGHVVTNGRPDAFTELAEIGVGEAVEIVDADGQVERYRVVRAGVVDKDELTTDQTVWGQNSSVRRLAIITCDDAYGFRSDGHRVANYVVIAEPA